MEYINLVYNLAQTPVSSSEFFYDMTDVDRVRARATNIPTTIIPRSCSVPSNYNNTPDNITKGHTIVHRRWRYIPMYSSLPLFACCIACSRARTHTYLLHSLCQLACTWNVCLELISPSTDTAVVRSLVTNNNVESN